MTPGTTRFSDRTPEDRARSLTRRGFLGAALGTLGLPLLEHPALGPLASLTGSARAAGAKPPLRLLFIFAPNGAHMPDWTPPGPGSELVLPKTLAPLAEVKSRLNVISGLGLDAARAHGDGPGDHARAAATFLTGVHPRKTAGANIRAGVSVDQLAAAALGRGERLASLELGTERSRLSGSCDSGYSCAYSSNISWRGESTPNAKEIVPRRVFDRLFGDQQGLSAAERAARKRRRASVLDLVRDDARALGGKLGAADRHKVDEYLEALRELERRIHAPQAKPPKARGEVPKHTPRDLGEHLDHLYDLIRFAFLTDSVRVATFMLGNAGSNRSYRKLGVSEGHHRLSHHGRDKTKREKIARIDRFHIERLARFLKAMAATREGDGSLLDNTLIVYGSAIGDGNRHNHDDLPILLAGGGGGVKGGRHLRFPKDTPLCELYLALLRLAGSRERTFGDAGKPLEGLV